VIKKSVLIFLPADDFNDDEYLIVRNELKKNKFDVFIVSDADCLCRGRDGLKVVSDVRLLNVHPVNFAAIILIGGSGIEKYFNNPILCKILRKFNSLNKIIGAVGAANVAASVLFGNAGIIQNITAVNSSNELFNERADYTDNTAIKENENIITAPYAQELITKIILSLNR
jgi:putative intracellular protease/amidase